MTQDRFKFRAWDKINKRLWHVVSPDFLLEDCLIGYSKNEGDSGIGWKMQITDLEIMQCTGLKDKNGVLIFEGDILDQKKFPQDTPCPCSVVFENGTYRKSYRNWNVTLPKPVLNQAEIDLFGDTVIGNIYENPELLKEGA